MTGEPEMDLSMAGMEHGRRPALRGAALLGGDGAGHLRAGAVIASTASLRPLGRLVCPAPGSPSSGSIPLCPIFPGGFPITHFLSHPFDIFFLLAGSKLESNKKAMNIQVWS
jgi:hypothetical protein